MIKCQYCDRMFKSRFSLMAHYFRSKYHKKGSPFYHRKPAKIPTKPTKSNTKPQKLDNFIGKDDCEHEFIYKATKMGKNDYFIHVYRCEKCGMFKKDKVKQGKQRYSVDELNLQNTTLENIEHEHESLDFIPISDYEEWGENCRKKEGKNDENK